MNSTPKDRVLRLHPQAYVLGGAGSWTVYKRPLGLGNAPEVLGRGTTPARAWMRAARRLLGPDVKKRGTVPRVQSFRGF